MSRPCKAVILVVAMAALTTALTTLVAAARGWMAGGDIRAELVGVQLAGAYPSDVGWREMISADGSSDYEEQGRPRQRGRWTVEGAAFCFVYPEQIQGGCFHVVKHGPNCYELYLAGAAGEPPADVPTYDSVAWNGRAWREAERSTCDDKNIS